MANASVSQMHELATTAEAVGFEPKDFAGLSNNRRLLGQVLQVIRGKAEIVMIAADKSATAVIQKVTDLLRIVKDSTIGATEGKEIGKSFVGAKYHHRDADLDGWLAKMSRAGVEGKITAYQLEKELAFKEIAQAILGLDEASIGDLAKALIAGGHTVVLPQIESLIKRIDVGEDTGLRTDGWCNFFFVEDSNGSVSVVRVYRCGDEQWAINVYRFDNEYRWGVGARFFSRN